MSTTTVSILPRDGDKLKEVIIRQYEMMLVDGFELESEVKDFYHYLNRVLNGRVTGYTINIPFEDDQVSADEIMSKHSDKLEHLVGKVEYGDLVENVAVSGYRTNGVYIVGSRKDEPLKLLDLADDPDDYGTIPSEFQVITEFPIRYWHSNVDSNSESGPFTNAYWHNSYVWFDPTKVDHPPVVPIKLGTELYYPFSHKDIRYAIVATKNNQKYVNLKELSYYYCDNSLEVNSEEFIKQLNELGYSDAQLLYVPYDD